MKNILVLTSIYPSAESPRGFTPVVHYFAKEWVKMGYNVKVIHNQTRYPFFFYWAPRVMRKYLEAKLGFALPVKAQTTEKHWVQDGVMVHRIPIFRRFPSTPFSGKTIKKQTHKILASNRNDNFGVDCILAHWTNPQLPIIEELNKKLNVHTSLVLHGSYDNILFKNRIKSLDIIGFRSKRLKAIFEQEYGTFPNTFMCHSGINEAIISSKLVNKLAKPINNYIYVGNLIPRKYPDMMLNALSQHADKNHFKICIVGDGPMRKKLINNCKEQGILANTVFEGHINREHVFEKLASAQCFIMISKYEAFGLVYLEAMAKGCIVVASKNEGMAGIINDGENGFLCEAGNEKELVQILSRIRKLPPEKRKEIGENAIKTAKEFTEPKVAARYLAHVTKKKEK